MKGASKIPSEEEESRQSTSSDVAIFQDSHDDEGVEDNMLSDLDKLYIALCEVDEAHLFDMFCYSLNIKSLNALKEYNSRPAILVHPYEIDAVKEKLANKDFDFKVLTNKKYERSGLVETCKIKHIPIIEMKDIAVTGTITEGPYVGMVCQALWTKPDGSKVEVCLRYKTDHEQNFLREADMANILRHRNILALYGVVISSSYSPSLALVVEFANYGNLEESFNHHTVERLCKFTIQAATALEHLEKKEVIHQWVSVFTCLVVADCQVNTVGELFVDLSRFLSSLRFDWLQVTLSRQNKKKIKKIKLN